MKYLSRSIKIIFVFILLVINFTIPSANDFVEAKTLRDLKNELAQKEQELIDSENKKQYTQDEINSKKNSINAIYVEIDNIQNTMLDLTKEIEKLTEEIGNKEQEIKKILNYYQVSNGESSYLEYVFDAADYTDFIYRMAIAEQLSDYNDKLIKEYNQKIKENKEKQKELDAKKVSLNSKQEQLQQELESLNNQLGDIIEENVSIEDEVKAIKEYVDTYENVYKCGLDEDLSNCGRDQLPPGTAFFRPLVSAMISANYGWYSPFGNSTWHYGMDFAGSGHGAPVYSIANGKVAAIMYRTSCGGNMVFVQHLVNGERYTSLYAHLADVNVSVGDIVTYNSVVGWVGGNPSYEYWDSCSTGTHLHLQTAYGWYMEDYYYYSGFTARSFDPRLIVNAPGLGTWFSSRTTRY